jgi:hypothetical protein
MPKDRPTFTSWRNKSTSSPEEVLRARLAMLAHREPSAPISLPRLRFLENVDDDDERA